MRLSSHDRFDARHRWGARSALAGLLAGGMMLGAFTPVFAESGATPQADADEQQVSGGSLQWGVRTSIRNYLENFGHTEGSVAAYAGASYRTGDSAASFPVRTGTVDPEAGTASIAFAGELEMRGFGEPWLHFEDVRLEIADGTAEIVVDMIESYNVSERTDDLTLAVFDVSDQELVVEDGALHLTTAAGTFPDVIGRTHLPAYGGPTYVAPNDRTDGFTLALEFAAETPGSGDDGDGTGDDDESGLDPETGPYGVSLGTSLSGTGAYMRVAPGYAINADGSTEITVEGYGFDPGPVVEPGTGTGGIYVGLGTMKNPADPEQWRRSGGGTSGPVGIGDYTYGIPVFVANQGSADAEVADGVMDANGHWTTTVTVPGSTIGSYFGDTIDCLAVQCGFFSFGAHGVTKAANEAFVPVFFTGQDESDWPERNAEAPTPIPEPEEPSDPGTDGTDEETPGTDEETPGTDDGTKGDPSGESTAGNDFGAQLTVAPAYALADDEQTVTLTGSGYPTEAADGTSFGGLYVLFGWVDPAAGDSWGPGSGGSSATSFTYATDGVPSGTYQRMVNFPGNTTEPGQPFMDEQGTWSMEFTIASSRFTSAQGREVDCYEMQCGIITIGAHGKALAAGEVFTPVYFTANPEDTGNAAPPTSGSTVTANPNLQTVQNSGTTVNGGLPGLAITGEGRGLVAGGVLLFSVGLLGAALLFATGHRRQRSAPAGT